jgi:hypothetical protein
VPREVRLKENHFFFVDQETGQNMIGEEFVFNDFVKEIKPNAEKHIVIDLFASIMGMVEFLDIFETFSLIC